MKFTPAGTLKERLILTYSAAEGGEKEKALNVGHWLKGDMKGTRARKTPKIPLRPIVGA